MSSNVSEKRAREVAEAAREAEWKLPSFGKELFLGNFRLDLIHPQPRLEPAGRQAAAKLLDGRYRWLEEGIADRSGDGPMIPAEVKESAAGVSG